ncbi:MAG: hypothetical protein ACXWC9_11125 [Pseudobdellovibrionaceae bacterium]
MSVDPSAFSAGADLWIVPERKKSRLVQKIDWYLNFQIAKSVQHQSKTVSKDICEILKNCALVGLKGYDFVPDESDALMILSNQNLPNRWVMILKGSEDIETWLKAAVQKWKKMNSPSVRIFLPEGLKQTEVAKLWKRLGGDENASLIEEVSNGK